MADYKYTPADFKSDQEVRWCPGCGDHAILSAVQRALPEIADALDTPHNLFTFVSGIGCSSRFIYYMKTYGFHSVHGRANAVATGVKTANPRLSVWVTTGDGDSLAIGGNHFIHAIRRNVDLNVILFNNEIYGLTKGQYSPTSKLGKITKTSPYGTVEKPFNPGELVIGAKGTFFARTIDMEVALSKECMIAAARHTGMSVIEALQNCVIFNDKTHADFAADKATRAERTVTLRHGEKMLFGANNEKGIVFENMKLKVVTVGQDGYTLDDVLTHDAHERDTTLHSMLAAMKYPDYPVALGVIRSVEDDSVYDRAVEKQVEEVNSLRGRPAPLGSHLGGGIVPQPGSRHPDNETADPFPGSAVRFGKREGSRQEGGVSADGGPPQPGINRHWPICGRYSPAGAAYWRSPDCQPCRMPHPAASSAAVVERRGGIDHRPVPGFGNQHPASQPDVPMADVLGRGSDVGETLQRRASGSVPKSFGRFFRKKFNSGADFSGRKLWK